MTGGSRDRWQLHAAIARSLERLAHYLDRQRVRGRTPTTDALAGLAIEEGEAEGLIAELARTTASVSSQPLTVADRDLDLPLARAVHAFELTPAELEAVVLAIAVELDARFARLVAFVNDHVGKPRPTLGLAFALHGDGRIAPEVLSRPLVRDGLIELEGDGPLSGLAVTIPRATLARLAGDDAEAALAIPGLRLERAPVRLADLVLDRETRDRLEIWSTRLTPLVVTGPAGVGRTTAARAAFAVVHIPTVSVSLDAADELWRLPAARREARWAGAGIIVRIPDDWRPRDSALLWAALAGVGVPVAIVAPPQHAESLATHAPDEPMTVALSRPDLVHRARLWQALVPEGVLSSADRDELAARYEFSPSAISRTIRRAAVERLDKDQLHAAARAIGSANISTIAQPLPLVYSRDDLVLPPRMLGELDLAIAWIRYKRKIYDTWGFGRRIALGRGLTALFAGPPGTGKTMTAQVLARDLGLDLYRVDLSRVMSKYIGETEKNLSRLFDEAQASGAALLFDEADALFGKRSESRDAHDRYANVEIGYLLQRMEEHEGVAILATNRVGDLDEAFLRRFHFLLDFPMPDAAYRLRLWHGMLPREVERAPDLDLGSLAATYELSGGEIRNCVLAAAYMAAAEGTCVRIDHLERGLRRELGKTGRIVVAPRRRTVEEEV